MSLINTIIKKVEAGINTFVAVCNNSNRDLPFHDFHFVEDPSVPGQYVVGSNQIQGNGDQKKFFVSKSTLVFCDANMLIRFNSTNNAVIYLLANTWYEFKSNIHSVFWDGAGNATKFLLYFEGVMYQEARRPE